MKTVYAERIKLVAEVIVAFTAITAIVLSAISISASNRANQIAERALQPQIKLVSQRLSAKGDNPALGISVSRTTLILFNGGEATSLVEVRGQLLPPETPNIEVSISGSPKYYRDVLLGANVLLNVWGNAPEMVEYFKAENIPQVMSVNGSRLPIQVPAHTTTEVVVDVVAVYKDGKSMFTPIDDILIISLQLDFPDSNSFYIPSWLFGE